MALRKRAVPARSLAERMSAAEDVRIEAIRQFEDAAKGLEAAAAEQKALAQEALDEAIRLNSLGMLAHASAARNLQSAEKIRDLFN